MFLEVGHSKVSKFARFIEFATSGPPLGPAVSVISYLLLFVFQRADPSPEPRRHDPPPPSAVSFFGGAFAIASGVAVQEASTLLVSKCCICAAGFSLPRD